MASRLELPRTGSNLDRIAALGLASVLIGAALGMLVIRHRLGPGS